MRRLPGIALGLFLAGAAGAQPSPPGWAIDGRSGCRIWNEHPVRGEVIAWSGGCANGLAEGEGTLQRSRDGKPWFTYTGAYRAGRKNGRGTVSTTDGFRLEGSFADDLPQGRCSTAWADGNRYEGDYVAGERTGRGVFTWFNGDRYEGGFRDGRFHGRGVFFGHADSVRVEGDWVDGRIAGQGVMTWANGSRYEGALADDRPHGTGTYRDASGEVYAGTWTNGCFRRGERRFAIGTTLAACAVQQ